MLKADVRAHDIMRCPAPDARPTADAVVAALRHPSIAASAPRHGPPTSTSSAMSAWWRSTRVQPSWVDNVRLPTAERLAQRAARDA